MPNIWFGDYRDLCFLVRMIVYGNLINPLMIPGMWASKKTHVDSEYHIGPLLIILHVNMWWPRMNLVYVDDIYSIDRLFDNINM